MRLVIFGLLLAISYAQTDSEQQLGDVNVNIYGEEKIEIQKNIPEEMQMQQGRSGSDDPVPNCINSGYSMTWVIEEGLPNRWNWPGHITEYQAMHPTRCQASCATLGAMYFNLRDDNRACRCYSAKQGSQIQRVGSGWKWCTIPEEMRTTCESGYSSEWGDEYPHSGEATYPGVLAEFHTDNEHCRYECAALNGHSYNLVIRSEGGCRCYSAQQRTRMRPLTGQGGAWIMCKNKDYFDPSEMCQAIVDAKDENGNKPVQEFQIGGKMVPIQWNIIDWQGTEIIDVTDRKLLAGPIKCGDQSLCSVSFTETQSKTVGWSMGGSSEINVGMSMGTTVGIPMIDEVNVEWHMDVSVSVNYDHSSEKSWEKSKSTTLSCPPRDFPTTCWIYETQVTFDTAGLASPVFTGSFGGQNGAETTYDCSIYKVSTEIDWQAMSAKAIESSEMPVCEDNIGWCDNADRDNCCYESAFITNCPATCMEYGCGSPVCAGGPECMFIPIPTGECPHMPVTQRWTPQCLEAYGEPGVICEAQDEFHSGAGPEDWQIQNCPSSDGTYMHNMFKWHCDLSENEMWNSPISRSSAQGASYSAGAGGSTGDEIIVKQEDSGRTVHIYLTDEMLSTGYSFGFYGLAIFGLVTVANVVVKSCRKSQAYTEIECGNEI